MKSGSFRGPPRKNINRSYKIFDFECFNIALKTKLDCIKGPTYNEFDEELFSVLNIHAPVKVKMLRHNNSAFVTKDLSKAIMKRSRLKNLFNKQRTGSATRCNRIIVLIYSEKLKRNFFFTNLNIKDIIDRKTIWKRIKPNSNEKGSNPSKIVISEKGSIFNDNMKICNTMNN